MPGRRAIGVDMGGTKLLAGVVDAGLSVHRRVQRTLVGVDQPTVLRLAVEAVQEACEGSEDEVVGVGFGIPCLIDRRTGRAVVAINLPLADIDFAQVMAERLGLPVFVDNDANLAALGEHRIGAAVGCDHVVMLTIGTGIGGGLILGGRLYRGAIGSAAELGHTVIDADGPPCQGNCPNHGCIEVLASGTALAREAVRLAAERPDSGLAAAAAEGYALAGPLVTELAHAGDAAAIEALELIGTRLGVAISSFINTFNPDVVVLGGGVMAAGELILAPARAEVARRALSPSKDEVQIVAAELGSEAGMVGAVALVFDELGGAAAEAGRS
jgi:glucokinase